MRPIDKTELLSFDSLEDTLEEILNLIITRIGIEQKRLQAVLSNLEKEYEKTKSFEFKNSTLTVKSQLEQINKQMNNIYLLAKCITNIRTATKENVNKFANDAKTILNSMISVIGNKKIELSEAEKII